MTTISKKAGNRSLLQAAFDVRVNHLSGKYNKVQNYAYLSGLLVGSELQSMDLSRALNIHLICSSELQDTYQTALKILAPLKNIKIHCPADANELVVQGHLKIGRYLKLL